MEQGTESGAVMFVIFVPSKQFEQGWWVQPCAETVSNGVLLNSSGSSNSSPPTNSTVKVNNEVGTNLKAALNACQNGGGGDERKTDTGQEEPQRQYNRVRRQPSRSFTIRIGLPTLSLFFENWLSLSSPACI